MKDFFSKLYITIDLRLKKKKISSYSFFLSKKGIDYCLKKFKEETIEFVDSVKSKEKNSRIIYEAADMLYHFFLILVKKKIKYSLLLKEMKRRTRFSGLEEKQLRKIIVKKKY